MTGYEYREFPLERAGIALHLDRVRLAGRREQGNILLTHGVRSEEHTSELQSQ